MSKIAVITGGRSSEREISLMSGRNVEETLNQAGYKVCLYDFPSDLEFFIKDATNIQFAFVMIHGKDGEDGRVPALLELLDIPFQGSASDVHALCLNKYRTKQIWRNAAIPVAYEAVECLKGCTIDEIEKIVGKYPVVIKSLCEGSTRGIFILKSRQDLIDCYSELRPYLESEVMIEDYIHGDEFTVSILEMPNGTINILPIIQIVPPEGEFFDYNNKYFSGKTKEICPALIEKDLEEEIKKIAYEAYMAVGSRGYGRIDLIVTKEKDVVLLEINTIPGFTKASLFPQAASEVGISFQKLLEILIETGKKK